MLKIEHVEPYLLKTLMDLSSLVISSSAFQDYKGLWKLDFMLIQSSIDPRNRIV
jgi:hypothetical protein